MISMEEIDIDFLIGRNLRRLREDRNLSQDELAEMMMVSKQRISGIETGREGMGKDLMARACKALKVELWEFYWTEKTPIIRNEREQQKVYRHREEEKLGIAEEVARYENYQIDLAKKKKIGSEGKPTPAPAGLAGRRRRKKSA